MTACFGCNGKSGPFSAEYQKELKEEQEKQLGAEAVEFWRTEKEKARSWVRGKPRVRTEKKS